MVSRSLDNNTKSGQLRGRGQYRIQYVMLNKTQQSVSLTNGSSEVYWDVFNVVLKTPIL